MSLSALVQPEADAAQQPSGATARLLLSSVDRPGITAAVSSFLEQAGANICEAAQYSTDPQGGRLFMRVAFHHAGLQAVDDRFAFERELDGALARFDMAWRVSYVSDRKRVALMVSRYDHCLLDLLWRQRRGELPCEMSLVVSNHTDLAEDVDAFDVSYEHIPVTPDTKPQAEERLLEVLGGQYDLVVLARYMQVLSGDLLDGVGCPIINIHHSFLPAFAGAGRYERARARREADRRDRPLRHRGPRRGSDHRAGHRARDPRRDGRRPDAHRP